MFVLTTPRQKGKKKRERERREKERGGREGKREKKGGRREEGGRRGERGGKGGGKRRKEEEEKEGRKAKGEGRKERRGEEVEAGEARDTGQRPSGLEHDNTSNRRTFSHHTATLWEVTATQFPVISQGDEDSRPKFSPLGRGRHMQPIDFIDGKQPRKIHSENKQA